MWHSVGLSRLALIICSLLSTPKLHAIVIALDCVFHFCCTAFYCMYRRLEVDPPCCHVCDELTDWLRIIQDLKHFLVTCDWF